MTRTDKQLHVMTKDYNHKNIKAPGNKVLLCEECHTAFHQLNHKNNLDWDYMN